MSSSERAQFEAFVRTQPGGTYYVLRRADFPDSAAFGRYVDPRIEFAWQSWQAARRAQASAEPVYIVATGVTVEGLETYTRHDVCPPLCDAERLFAVALQKAPLTPLQHAMQMAWDDMSGEEKAHYTKVAERAHGITDTKAAIAAGTNGEAP